MSQVLWRLHELVKAVSGRLVCDSDTDQSMALNGVSIDSRDLQQADIFVAIKGDRYDGHDFVGKAFASGAGVALVSEHYKPTTGDGPLVVVPDSLEGLNDLARAARARSLARIIAVTGSVGKTGTKEMLKTVLATSGKAFASDKSFNNHWGVPLSLSRLPADADYGIFEVGMNHPGEITPLTKMIRPHVAIITTVEAVHLGQFKSVEEIADAKAEIFEGLEPDGIAVLNRDNPYFRKLWLAAQKYGARLMDFGTHRAAFVQIDNAEYDGHGSSVCALVDGVPVDYKLSLPGRHIVMNSLAVLATIKAVGAQLERAAAEFVHISPSKGRGERTEVHSQLGKILLIDESYNANPASMRAAFAALAQLPRRFFGRRVVVIGDMLELGGQSDELHAALVEPIIEAGVDAVFACGEHMKELFEALPTALRGGYASDAESLRPVLLGAVRDRDVIMIKGSFGSHMGSLVEALKFDLPPESSAESLAENPANNSDGRN
jgi:UDP-N-acetylmuramoyl-tripeptide--D-alanyl-D-alanine ligase